jgi:AcrR family transcriptional regulator
VEVPSRPVAYAVRPEEATVRPLGKPYIHLEKTAEPVRTSEKTALTRERIVDAAVDLIEEEGIEALSMRRVAARLGVAAMSLYNHVPSKDALLDGVAGQVMSQMGYVDDPAADWRDRGRDLCRAFRDVARRHPRCVSLVLTRKAMSPAALRPVEYALDIAADAGFDGPRAIQIMRVLMSYALGTIVRENGFGQMIKNLHSPPDGVGDDFPRVSALIDLLITDDYEADFEFGLDLLIHAISLLQADIK